MKDVKHKLLVDLLCKDIIEGKYRFGDPFPSERALVRKTGYSRITVQHALRELEKLGWISRHQGRGTFITKNGQSRKVGLIVPALSKAEIFSVVCQELSVLCQERDRLLLFADEKSDAADKVESRLDRLADKFIEDGVAGVIFHPVDYCPNAEAINRKIIDKFDRARVPVVLLDCDIGNALASSEYDHVGIDNIEAGWRVGRHVIDRGARKIMFVMRSKWASNVWRRLLGLKSAASEVKGVRVEDFFVASESSKVRLLRTFRRKCPDAIVCSSDAVAANVMQLLAKAGRRVPQDVLVTGINDVEIARITSPSLTSIHQPCEEIARTVLDILEWRMSHPKARARHVNLSASLVVRASTGGGSGS